MRPRLKPFVEYCYDKGKISFFARPGAAIEVDDENRFILTVCCLMDGERDVAAIKQDLSQDYPEDANYLEELLTLFDMEGLVEDVSVNQVSDLTKYELDRWSRNIEFFGAYCRSDENKYLHQEALKNTKVTIIGVGGVGSSVLLNLAALGARDIRIVDFDRIELSNLNRQILYNDSDIGKSKADVAKEKIVAFYPDAKIEAISTKINSSEDIEKLIEGRDFVINAADQPRGKIIDWLNAACVKQALPFICGALDFKYAICYSVLPGKTGCIECWKSSARESNPVFQDYYHHEGFRASSMLNVTIMPFISIVVGLMATEFLKIVTNIQPPQSLGSLRSFDFETGLISELESWAIDADCEVCVSRQSEYAS